MRHYRDIPLNKILKFKSTSGFKGWKHLFTKESVTHPAKMNLNLLRWILQKYTAPSETVLDPMAGTGSTVVLAGAMGRNGIAVEYEAKFCKMIEENIWRTRNQGTLTPRGKMACINGDARELSKQLIESDVIISSPPYGNRLSDVAVQDGDSARMGYRQAVDIVLTSPPYSNSNVGGDNDEKRITRMRAAIERGEHIGDRNINWLKARQNGNKQGVVFDKERNYSRDPNNLANLPHGNIDTVISSPPYGKSHRGGGIFKEGYRPSGEKEITDPNLPLRQGHPISDDPLNIDNLEYGEIDAVISSPPYEGGPFNHAGGHGGAYAGGIASRDENFIPVSIGEENIGNLKGETYLEAMRLVYQECYNVLTPRGKMVLVVKNFIRDKQVVRLDSDTIKLCESVGFNLIERWYFDLPVKSFWKILYHRKYPDVNEVKYEDILVFEKNVGVPPKSRLEE